MKTNSKKIILGLGLALLGNFSFGQGLEGIVVEKFYQANAADATNASNNGASPLLNSGAVTYRIYVNMASGYKFSQLYGTASHPMTVSTTTNFFNDPNSGSTTNPAAVSATNARKNTALLDSWFTTGGAAGGKLGVLKSEDTDGSPGNAQGVLQNNPGGAFGLPVNIGTTQNAGAADGMIAGTVVAPNVLGISAADLAAIDASTGNTFTTTTGAIAALGGVVGPTASNMVLIGQFTTDGVLSYHLNVQLVNIASGVAENYVSSSPVSGELTNATLNLVPNIPPVVSVTAPSNGAAIITGTAVNITANATDSDGTVSQVEFFVDNVSIGVDNSNPYAMNWTATAGAHAIKAVATDNSTDVTTSTVVNVNVANNQAPTITLSAPANAISLDVVTLTATAADVDGSVASVQFLVDNVVVGTVNAPSAFTFNWTATTGTHSVKAIATDNLGLTTTSSSSNIVVAANVPPTAVITAPLATASYVAPAVVTINATATDADGTVALVEFLVNGSVVSSTSAAGPSYTYNWTSTIGTKNITVRSTDNKGAVTTSSVLTLTIADPNALPYQVDVVDQLCNLPTFCVPVAAAVTYTAANVKGYDVTLNYDKTKLTPTGNITLYGNMINASYIEQSNSIDAVNGVMNIVINLKGTAPANASFNGNGDIFCVEFTKTGTFAQIDTAIVSVPFLQESYITGVATKSVSAGKAITHRNEHFPGALRFWSDNSAIKYDAASPNSYLVTKIHGATAGVVNPTFVTPNTSGNFDHLLTNGLDLNFERDVNNLSTVQLIVNAADAVLGKTLLLNNVSFTPSIYQILALDVNLDGVISAGDISQMKQRATLSIGEYQQAWNYSNAGVSNGQASKDWVFVDSNRIVNNAAYHISATFPANDNVGFSKGKVPVVPFTIPTTVSSYANCPVITGETYKGIMLGDVDGNYATYTADGILKSAPAGKIIFDLAKATSNGSTVDVPVTIVSAEPVNALDFAFNFNEDKMSFNSVEALSSEVDGFGFFNTNDRVLRYTANNMSNFELNNAVLTVRFNSVDGKISAADINNTLGLLNGKKATVEFEKSAAGLVTMNNNFATIFPNPTTGLLNIVAQENSTVQVLDITGQQVLIQANANANEKQTINMDGFSSGVYFVKVFNNNFSKTERVVINK